MSVIRRTVAAMVLTGSCTACTVGGSAGSRSSQAEPTMTTKQAKAVMTEYDQRNNAAIRKSGAPAYDETAWRGVDSREAYATDIMQTRLAKAAKTKVPPVTLRHRVAEVMGTTTSGGRETVVMRGRITGSQPAGGAVQKAWHRSWDQLWVIERTSASARWTLADDLAIEGVTLPRAGVTPDPAGSRASVPPTPSPAPVASVIKAFEEGSYDGLADAGPIRETVKAIQVAPDITTNFSCYPRSTRRDTISAPPGSPDAVRVDYHGASLMLLRLRCEVDHWARGDDARISVPEAQAKVDGLPRSTVHGPEAYAMTVLLRIPSSGQASLLTVDTRRVLRREVLDTAVTPGHTG